MTQTHDAEKPVWPERLYIPHDALSEWHEKHPALPAFDPVEAASKCFETYVNLSALPDIVRGMVKPLVWSRHPIGWNCEGFMIDTRASNGRVYVMRGLYGKPEFESVEAAKAAAQAHHEAQVMASLGIT